MSGCYWPRRARRPARQGQGGEGYERQEPKLAALSAMRRYALSSVQRQAAPVAFPYSMRFGSVGSGVNGPW